MFVTYCISTTKIQKISEITKFFKHFSYPELRLLHCCNCYSLSKKRNIIIKRSWRTKRSSRPFFISFLLCFNLLYLISSVHVVPFLIDACENSARDAMPSAADSARKNGERLGGKEIASEHGGKTGILHTHLDADGALLGCVETCQSS